MKLAEEMMVSAYMKYLHEAVQSVDSYSTKRKYTEQLTEHFQNPEQTEKPPHFEDALQEIRNF